MSPAVNVTFVVECLKRKLVPSLKKKKGKLSLNECSESPFLQHFLVSRCSNEEINRCMTP